MLGNLSGLSELQSVATYGLDQTALAWLAFTAMLMLAAPPVGALFYYLSGYRDTCAAPLAPDHDAHPEERDLAA